MPDQGIRIVQKVQHHKQAHFIELSKLPIRNEQLFVLESSESPKMGKPLNWGLLLCSVNFGERPFDSFSEFIREKSTERNDKVNDFGVHVWEVKKCPKFLERKFLIIISDLFAFFLDYDQLEAVVNGMTLLPHQNLHSGFDWCEWNNRIRKFDALLNSSKPLRKFADPFFWQVPLNLDNGHRADFVSLFVALDIGNGLDEVTKSHKEGLKVLNDL